MTPPPINIDGTDITGATIDGQDVEQITIDGQDVLSAIPDSGDLQAAYDLREESFTDGDSISTLNDQSGNGFDATAGVSPTFKASTLAGSEPVARFDGSDDFLDVGFNSTLTQPFSVCFIARQRTTGDFETIFDDTDGGSRGPHFRDDSNGTWVTNAGSKLSDGAADTNAHIFSVLYDGASSVIRVDGSQTTGNAGTTDSDGITLGKDSFDDIKGQWDLTELLYYQNDKSGRFSDIESYLDRNTNIL